MKSLNLKKVLVSSLLLASLPAAQAADWTGNVSGYLGQKTMDDSDWPAHHEQGSVGLLLDVQRSNWPVSIAFDVFGTGNEKKNNGEKHNVYTAESHLGVRKHFELANASVSPYIGGGLALVYLEEENTALSDSKMDDTAAGAWIGTGLYARITEHFQLGADLRYSEAEVTVFGADRKAGGLHAGVTAGYHW